VQVTHQNGHHCPVSKQTMMQRSTSLADKPCGMDRRLLGINRCWELEQRRPENLVHGFFLDAYCVFHGHQPQQQKVQNRKQLQLKQVKQAGCACEVHPFYKIFHRLRLFSSYHNDGKTTR
jgi:hypothetical protein